MSARHQLVVTVERQLLTEHLTGILQKGLDQLVEENRVSDLTLLYALFNRVKNGTIELCGTFNAYIKVNDLELWCVISVVLLISKILLIYL